MASTTKRSLAEVEPMPTTTQSKMLRPSKNEEEDEVEGDEEEETDPVEDIFNKFKNAVAAAQEEISTEEYDDSYITVEEFNAARLNVIKQNTVVEIKATMTHFNEFLDEQIKNQTLSDLLTTIPDSSTHYNILYSFLVQYFTQVLKGHDDVLKLIIFVLQAVVVFKDKFKHSQFVNRINGIVNMSSDSFDVCQYKNLVKRYLAKQITKNLESEDVEESASPSENYHFLNHLDMFDILKDVFNLCIKITRISTHKNMMFKDMSRTKAESRDPDTKSVVSKPAQRIQLQTPILIKLTKKNISDGIVVYTCDEDVSEEIVEQIKNSMLFKKKNTNDKMNIRFYQNVNIGELKKMHTLKIYESSNKPISNTSKDSICEDMYVITNGFIVIYNETADRFGLSIKCWPTKHNLDDGYGNYFDVHVLDFTHDKKLFEFLQ